MQLLAFFDEVPKVRVRDPLSKLLGCAIDGELEYGYGDAVRLAGHSCPSVASAYWMTYLALERLSRQPGELPQRGGLRVDFREDARSGTTGVMAAVVQLLTGAAGSSGFKGLRGRYARVGLIRYAPEMLFSMRFTRLDNRDSVEASVNMALAPGDPHIDTLLPLCLEGKATAQQEQQLAQLWQERVRHLLLDLGRDEGVFVVRDVERKGVRKTLLCPSGTPPRGASKVMS